MTDTDGKEGVHMPGEPVVVWGTSEGGPAGIEGLTPAAYAIMKVIEQEVEGVVIKVHHENGAACVEAIAVDLQDLHDRVWEALDPPECPVCVGNLHHLECICPPWKDRQNALVEIVEEVIG